LGNSRIIIFSFCNSFKPQDSSRTFTKFKIIQFSVEILHYLLILRVAITYLKNIYLQIKEFGIINRKGNKNLGLKASKRKIYKSKALVRKGNKNISHKVSTRRISKSK